MDKRRFLSMVLCTSCALLLIETGCKKKEKASETVPGSDAYSCSIFEVPEKKGFDVASSESFFDEGSFCVSVLYQSEKTAACYTDIYTLNEKGEPITSLEFKGNQIPSAVFPEEYALIGVSDSDLRYVGVTGFSGKDTVVVFLDKKTGEVTRTIVPEFRAYFIVPITDGFVIGGENDIALYSIDGTLQKSVHTGFMIAHNDAFFEKNGSYYVYEEDYDNFAMILYSIDFDNGTCQRLVSSKDLDKITLRFMNEFCFRSDGEYRIDVDSLSLVQVIDWNRVDIRPQRKALSRMKEYTPIDADHFALTYVYSDGSAEMLLFSHDANKVVQQKKKITIGGSDIFEDLPLQWLVYQFNTTDQEYRVVLDDYSRYFMGTDADELRRGQLSMIQYFNEGNTPDIFYGNKFDYESMGRKGMVFDLKPYLDKSPELLDGLTESGKRLMVSGDGKCYQVFASYWLNGCIGLQEQFQDGNDVSVRELLMKAENASAFPYGGWSDSAECVVEYALFYGFQDVWGVYDDEKKITQDDLKGLLDLAYEIQANRPQSSSEYRGIDNGSSLLISTTINSLSVFYMQEQRNNGQIRFVGFPGISGSVHVAIPSCCLAMSTTASDPEKCWELMSVLFSTDVQKVTAANGEIPVKQDVLEMVCQAFLDSESETDEVINSQVLASRKYGNIKITQDVVDDYLEAVYSADTLTVMDQRLYSIIYDEVNSYYTQNRSTEQIAESLMKRLDLYAEENYQ